MAGKNVIDLDSGIYMVVADLHGNLEDYKQVTAKFVKGKEEGSIDGIIFAGDTIHSYSPLDNSKAILDHMMALKEKYGNSIIPLLGNHELPSIYRYILKKGSAEGKELVFGSDFEHQIKDERDKYIGFLKSFAIAVRTKGGLIINHAGPTDAIDYFEDDLYESHLEHITNLDHDAIFAENKESWNDLDKKEKETMKDRIEITTLGLAYEKALELLAIDSKDKGRKEELVIGEYFKTRNVDGQWLWGMFTNTNLNRLGRFIERMSEEKYQMRILLQGHEHPGMGVGLAKGKNAVCFTTSEGVDDILQKRIALIDTMKIYDLESLVKSVVPLYSQEEVMFKANETLRLLSGTLEKYPSLKSCILPLDKKPEEVFDKFRNIILDEVTNRTFIDLLSVLESITRKGIDGKHNIEISHLSSDGRAYTLEYDDHFGTTGNLRVEGDFVLEKTEFGDVMSKLVKDDEGFRFIAYEKSVLGGNSKKVIPIPKKEKD